MDPQKSGLKPELQAIYEKVMSTPVKSPVTPTASPPPPQTSPQLEIPREPTAPGVPPPIQTIETVPPQVVPPTQSQTPSPSSATASSFTFSTTESPQEKDTLESKTKGKMGKLLTGALVLIFLVVYTVFWLFFFKVIDPSILPFPFPSL